MTKLCATISGQFTKMLVLGAFLPAAVFVMLNIILVLPLLPVELPLAERLGDLEGEWQAAIALLVAIVVACLLYNLNIPLIRFYEGYPFEDSWLGRKMRDRQASKLAQMDEEINRLRAQRKGMSHDEPSYAKVERELTLLWFERRLRFPPATESVMPTSLGNVIAAFEHYAPVQYGIDSVTLWPRLVAKIDETYAAVIDDAKTSFDFFINSCFLSALLAVEYVCVGLCSATRFSSGPAIAVFLGTIAILGGLSWLAHRCCIDSAIAWGHHVKAAFDLYRWDLLTALGYGAGFSDNPQEVRFWTRISQAMMYGEPRILPPYEAPGQPETKVDAEPSDVVWSITKGVERPAPGARQAPDPRVIRCVLTVKNTSDKKADTATLVDTAPLGSDYIMGSARACKNKQSWTDIAAVGTNPYHWDLGAVDAGQTVTVTYAVLLRRDAGEVSN